MRVLIYYKMICLQFTYITNKSWESCNKVGVVDYGADISDDIYFTYMTINFIKIAIECSSVYAVLMKTGIILGC